MLDFLYIVFDGFFEKEHISFSMVGFRAQCIADIPELVDINNNNGNDKCYDNENNNNIDNDNAINNNSNDNINDNNNNNYDNNNDKNN